MPLATVALAPGREAPFVGGHPWVFSGAVGSVSGSPDDGAEVRVVDHHGAFVARGLYNSRSQIRVRLYRWRDEPLDRAFFARRIADAVALRRDLPEGWSDTGACRLIFSEGDGLSGLTVDRYGPYLTVQFTSLALARRMDELLDLLEETVAPRGIVLRTEKGILEEEGLELSDGLLRGAVPDEPFVIEEGGLRFGVDLRTGQKTGFYLDQRANRLRAARYLEGRSVADVCCYTGGFALTLAAAGAASVVGVDVSASALELATRNAALNGLAASVVFEKGDAFSWLGAQVEAGRRFGMIVLDPPRFARSRRGVPHALSAYERLNRLALQCLEPGGILVTCSCSGRVSGDDFLGAVGRAAGAEGVHLRVLERLTQGPDHPVAATCPESAYLKCLICRME